MAALCAPGGGVSFLDPLEASFVACARRGSLGRTMCGPLNVVALPRAVALTLFPVSGLHGRPPEEQEPAGQGVGSAVRLPGGAQQLARGPEGGEPAEEPLPGGADLYVAPGAPGQGRVALRARWAGLPPLALSSFSWGPRPPCSAANAPPPGSHPQPENGVGSFLWGAGAQSRVGERLHPWYLFSYRCCAT